MKIKFTGLSEDEVVRSYNLHGDNSLVKEKKKGFIKRFFENLSDPIIRILFLALGLQLIVSLGNVNYFELGGILVAILLSTTVSTISEYRSDNSFEKMVRESKDGLISVLRGGKLEKINVSNIVVGDLVYLSGGDIVPADGEMIDGKIYVDQSALNGESREIVKSVGRDTSWDLASISKIFRGTVVVGGSGLMRVMRIGQSTYYGMVAKDVQSDTRESPLKLRLGKLASQISRIGYVASLIVGISYLFNAIVIDNKFNADLIINYLTNAPQLFSTILKAITLMITMVVVSAPEGLPMMITVVLSANMKRMINDKILVKKLVGIETAGSMNILFTDKTGTITEGRPTCDRFIYSFGSTRSLGALKNTGAIYENLLTCAKYNTDVVEAGGSISGGNATDRSIYEYFRDCKFRKEKIRSKNPFSSEQKYSSVILENGKTIIKGAAEIILTACKYTLNKSGEKIRFDKLSVWNEYLEAVNHGERVVAVAISDEMNSELCFVALIAMKDKIRPGVIDAVKAVQQAGIRIVMITGDGRETAKSIAEECGIFSRKTKSIIISGEELRRLDDRDVRNLLPDLSVVYRALPQDKTRLVRLSQELDMVVGMTGDGINDSPSLKLSDVGFAMGSGADIAKSAADIVILDNGFLAISKTILYGRTIFKSIRKFITFQLTMNIAACGVSLLGQFFGIDTPITITQMLWVNIIMDTLGGLAFAGEAPLDYYMREKPKRRDERILSREMISQIAITGLFTLGICILFLTSPVIRLMYGGINPTDKFYTAFYVLFIFCGIFNCFSARCSRLWMMSNISKNKAFIIIMILISVIQICMVYYGGAMFRCVPLLRQELTFAVLLASSVVPFEMIRRLVYKLK